MLPKQTHCFSFIIPTYEHLTYTTIQSLVYSHMFQWNPTIFRPPILHYLKLTRVYYITVIYADELQNVSSLKMSLKFYAWCIILGFTILHNHLILCLIHYGSCPVNISNLLIKSQNICSIP
jgi:hypothetical protein